MTRPATAALETLCYCGSLEILLRLDQLRKEGIESRKTQFENAFNWVHSEFLSYSKGKFCDSSTVGNLREWLAPVQHLLTEPTIAESETESATDESEYRRLKIEQPEPTEEAAKKVIADLGDLNGKCRGSLQGYWGFDWRLIRTEDRSEILVFLSSHSDPQVREHGCWAAGVWNDKNTIVQLLHDPIFSVRKSAAYCSQKLDPTEDLAEMLWDHLHTDVSGSAAIEALESFIKHTSRTDLNDVLVDLALNDKRPSVKYTAIHELSVTTATPHIQQLLPLLSHEAFNTWAVHIAVLEAIKRTNIEPPSLVHLQNMDNLLLQVALAEIGS